MSQVQGMMMRKRMEILNKLKADLPLTTKQVEKSFGVLLAGAFLLLLVMHLYPGDLFMLTIASITLIIGIAAVAVTGYGWFYLRKTIREIERNQIWISPGPASTGASLVALRFLYKTY